MPTSHWRQVSQILGAVLYVRPASVLDVGTGLGKYGLLCREYLECWLDSPTCDDLNGRRPRIDGIEIWEKYLSPVHDFVYDNIYVGNALDLLPTLGEYDCILAVDVLEHFERDAGRDFLRLCLDRGRNVLVSTPRNAWDHHDEELAENAYERHRSQWVSSDFDDLGRDVCRLFNTESHVLFIGIDAPRVRAQVKRVRTISAKQFVRNEFPLLGDLGHAVKVAFSRKCVT